MSPSLGVGWEAQAGCLQLSTLCWAREAAQAGSQLAGMYMQACWADQPQTPLLRAASDPSPSPEGRCSVPSICPRPLRPSLLTSIIFSSIHLVIHVHGKFLKKPVAELEAQSGTQALSGQLAGALSADRASSPGCHQMWETACVPCATQPPQSQNWKVG